jgi:Cytochrome P460
MDPVVRCWHDAAVGPSRPSTFTKEELVTTSKRMRTIAIVTALVSALGGSAVSAQDRYTVKVPGGLAFSEFKGYENWEFLSLSQSGKIVAAILANPVMIEAYKKGIPANGKPVPDGAKMAKIHWTAKQSPTAPSPTTVPGTLHDIDFMVKDSKRFADSGGWGYGAFMYDAGSGTFTPATTADVPPQANDAKCGFGCHTIVKSRDYVFTEYPAR